MISLKKAKQIARQTWQDVYLVTYHGGGPAWKPAYCVILHSLSGPAHWIDAETGAVVGSREEQ